jgi:nucleotide-binding universal stress UspA family protein
MEALRVAAALALDARLVLIRADHGEDASRTSDDLRRLSRWLPPELIDRCELKVVGASAAEDLASFAAMAGADLIAGGAPQTHALGDFLRGTATDRIVQHSECPVLVVNSRAARRETALVATEQVCAV